MLTEQCLLVARSIKLRDTQIIHRKCKKNYILTWQQVYHSAARAPDLRWGVLHLLKERSMCGNTRQKNTYVLICLFISCKVKVELFPTVVTNSLRVVFIPVRRSVSQHCSWLPSHCSTYSIYLLALAYQLSTSLILMAAVGTVAQWKCWTFCWRGLHFIMWATIPSQRNDLNQSFLIVDIILLLFTFLAYPFSKESG